MDAKEIIKFIQEAEKKTPVKVVLKSDKAIDFPNCKVFEGGGIAVIYGDWKDVEPVLEAGKDEIEDYVVENGCRNSAIPMRDLKGLNARIEPGAIIRDWVEIGDNAVIMMDAVINIGAVIGEGTMIDMGAVLGGRATVGKNCHINAGTVLAGVVEPPSAQPVTIEDDVVIGANSVVIEGVKVGKGSVVAAGSVVLEDVPPGAVVGGTPARFLKYKDDRANEKTEIVEALRQL